MQLLGSLAFHVGSAPKLLELFQGDLSRMAPHDGVDVLVVSAFPGDYTPTATSLIGALDRAGVSVRELAAHPRYDLREYWASWLSHDVPEQGFRRLLCYEPARPEDADHGVDAIFRALGPFIGMKNGVRRVALPVVGAGDRGRDVAEVLPNLLEAAYDALSTTALERVRLVEFHPEVVSEVQALFDRFKAEHLGDVGPHGPLPHAYDVFISYSQRWSDDASIVHEALLELEPGLRIFQDTQTLRVGHDHRTQLDLAIRSSARVVPLYTPEYLVSDSCKDEFNTAWALRGAGAPDLLFPMFVRERGLDGQTIGPALDQDSRKTTLQYEKCVEGDRGLLRAACRKLLSHMAGDTPKLARSEQV